MAYIKIVYQNSPSTATPLNAENLNHMDDQIALNDQRLTELEGAHVSSFNGRTGAVAPESGDYNISQIAPLSGAQVGQVPVVTNIGTEEDPKLVFRMGAGGGGGHSIIDSEGNTMPQETAMQFADSFVSDDETNGRTIVENIKEHTTASDYENATEDGIHVIDDGNDVPIGEIEEDVVSVTADGVKTWAQLLNDLNVDLSKITYRTAVVVGDVVYPIDYIGSDCWFQRVDINTPNVTTITYLHLSSNETWSVTRGDTSSSGTTDISSTVLSQGTKITLYYGNKKAVVDLQTTANRCWYDSNTTVKQKLDSLPFELVETTGTTDSSGYFNLGANAKIIACVPKDYNSACRISAILVNQWDITYAVTDKLSTNLTLLCIKIKS